MNTMKWLLRREFWEHKGMFLWAPLAVGLLLVVFVGGSIAYGGAHGAIYVSFGNDGLAMNGGAALSAMSRQQMEPMTAAMASSFMALSTPIFLMLSVILFFYCLGAMYDERRDRSILFWKSLPVSDRMTVLSKVATALCLAPLIAIAVAAMASATVLLMLSTSLAFMGANVFGALLGNAELYLTPLKILGLLPVYALWALPTIGWLLMVSSWARSKVFLWAVGMPIMSIVVIRITDYLYGFHWNIDWFTHNVVLRGLAGLVPGIWFAFERVARADFTVQNAHMVDASQVFASSWQTLSGPSVWIGAAAGVAMIAAAIRLRRWRDDG